MSVGSPGEATSPTHAGWSPRTRWAAIAGLLALYAFFSFWHLRDLPLLDPDEPRYATAGRNMAEGGSWIIPEFNGEPRINKPPLFYWLVALSTLVCGAANEVSVRLPSILMGLAMLGLTVWVGARLYGEPTGLLAGAVLATSPLFMAMSRACVIDQTFSTLLAAALFCLLMGLCGRWPWPLPHEAQAEGRGTLAARLCSPIFLCGVMMGLAFMAKGTATAIVLLVPFFFVLCFYHEPFFRGPGLVWTLIWLLVVVAGLLWGLGRLVLQGTQAVGGPGFQIPQFAIAAAVMAVLAMLYYGLRNFWRTGPWVLALIVACFLASWWYLVLIYEFGVQHFVELVRFEIVGRLKGKVHREDWYYYFYIFPALLYPWSTALPAALGSAWQRVRYKLPLPRHSPVAAVRTVADPFLIAWVLVVAIFFSIPQAKLAGYMLPAFPAAALLTARFLMRLGSVAEPVPKGWRVAVMGIALVAALAVGIGFSGVIAFKGDFQRTLDAIPVPQALLSAVLAVIIAVPWLAGTLTRRPAWTVAPVVAFFVLFMGYALPTAIPHLHNRSNKIMAGRMYELAHSVNRCISVGCEEESLVFYLNLEVREARRPDGSKGETYLTAVHEALTLEPPGELLAFVHRKYFFHWMHNRVPDNCTKVLEDGHIVVLLNKPPAAGAIPDTEELTHKEGGLESSPP